VERGTFYGMGYVPNKIPPANIEQLKELVTRYRDNSYMHRIVQEHAEQYPQKVITL
jgi:DNA polymerase-3 subunit epsilon